MQGNECKVLKAILWVWDTKINAIKAMKKRMQQWCNEKINTIQYWIESKVNKMQYWMRCKTECNQLINAMQCNMHYNIVCNKIAIYCSIASTAIQYWMQCTNEWMQCYL